MLRFRKLKLKNWRNFQNIDIDLQARAFFVGANASGKSNLLDALRFLHDIANPVGGGFQAAVRSRGGIKAIRCLMARQDPEVEIAVEIGTDEATEWTYRLAFKSTKKDAPIVTHEEVCRAEVTVICRSVDAETESERGQTYLEQQSQSKQFPELPEFLGSITYRHIVPQIVRSSDKWQGVKDDPYGGGLIAEIADTTERIRKARLDKITTALQAAVPQMDGLRMNSDKNGVWHLEAKYKHWRPQGAWQTEASFSDGTLRLIGLVWLTMAKGGPLLLEEPEVSLHAGIVERLVPMFSRAQNRSGKQVIITTHSRELLSDPGLSADEVFLLTDRGQGTEVSSASSMPELMELVKQGLTLGEVALPKVASPDARQLSLFDVTSD